MKKVLITGASGFVGSFLVQEALNQGFEVYAGIRTTSKKDFLTDPRINFIELGLSRKEMIVEKLTYYEKKIGRFDFVIHNAGVTKSHKKNDFDRVNFQYTKNIIEALIEANCVPDKFVYISSLAAYGPGDEKNMQPITELSVPNPVSLYGKSKLKSEEFIYGLKDFPYLIFRPTGVYGPREKDYFLMYKSIKNHLETYVGSSQQQITFVYVKDLASLIIKSLNSNISAKSYFVTDGNSYTAEEFSEIVKKHLNVNAISIVFPKTLVKIIAYCLEKLFAIFGKVPTINTEKYKEISAKNWLCNSEKVYRDFNTKPNYNLYAGLKETISWYQQKNLL